MSRASNVLIAQGVAEGLGGFAKGYAQREQQKKLQMIMDDPNATEGQKIAALSPYPQAQKEYLRTSARRMNLQSIENNVRSQIEGGVGSGQTAARNATNPNQLIQNLDMTQPEVANAPVPGQEGFQNQQQNVPQQQDPIQELGRQEKIYKDAALQYTNADLPEQARRYESLAKSAQKERLDIQNSMRQQEQFQQKQVFEIDKRERAKYDTLENDANAAKKTVRAREAMRAQLATGKLNPTNFRNLAANLFKGHPTLEGLFTTPEREVFKSAGITQFEGMKDIFGVRLSDADLAIASSKVMDPTKPVEANLAIADYWDFADRMKIEEAKIAREVKKGNGGFLPIDWKEVVDQKMQERFGDEAQRVVSNAANEGGTKPLKIVDGKVAMVSSDGKRKLIPVEDLKKALLSGGIVE